MREIRLRRAARDILREGLKAVEPERLIRGAVKRGGSLIFLKGNNADGQIDLQKFNKIYVVAFGKAAPHMARAFLKVLNNRINEGLVVCLPRMPFSWPGVKRLEAPHPFPDKRSLQAAARIIELGRKVGPGDLVFFLISGGASSQVAKPQPPLTLGEKIKVIRSLMSAGADIKELNIVRKHLSAVKGGKLGEAFRRAVVVNLIISDVIDDDLETIASAPTTWDSSTFHDAKAVLEKYGIWKICSQRVKGVIDRGIDGFIQETRKKEQTDPTRLHNIIIGNNQSALQAAADKARKLGYKALVISRTERGEAREAARVWTSLVHSLVATAPKIAEPLALISGGELTVTVKGKGKGGRNTEFCLALLRELQTTPLPPYVDWLGASLATDGRDGPTDSAGALVSADELKKAMAAGLDLNRYLENNDSYTFFKKVKSLIVTGATKTNVMDIRLFLLASK